MHHEGFAHKDNFCSFHMDILHNNLINYGVIPFRITKLHTAGLCFVTLFSCSSHVGQSWCTDMEQLDLALLLTLLRCNKQKGVRLPLCYSPKNVSSYFQFFFSEWPFTLLTSMCRYMRVDGGFKYLNLQQSLWWISQIIQEAMLALQCCVVSQPDVFIVLLGNNVPFPLASVCLTEPCSFTLWLHLSVSSCPPPVYPASQLDCH